MNSRTNLIKFQIFFTIFEIILGTILHFTYTWSKNNSLVGLFSAVNESTWEHLKLLFFPMLISTIVGYFTFQDTFPNFLCSKTIGIITAMLFTVIFFYTYTGIIGTNYAFANILTFILSVIIGEYVAYILTINNFTFNKIFCISILIILTIFFFIFTFNPPKINLFKDPINGSYGIQKNSYIFSLKVLFLLYTYFIISVFIYNFSTF